MSFYKIGQILLLTIGLPALPVWSGDDVPPTFPVCYDFSCKTEQIITISQDDWQKVMQIFEVAGETPYEERLKMKQGVAMMEQIVGRYTPTFRDVAYNWVDNTSSALNNIDKQTGQLDCIDESINTTTYLTLFEKSGMLAFHSVVQRAYRKTFFDQHWAAQFIEHQSGEKFVLDSWFEDNGEPPILANASAWQNFN